MLQDAAKHFELDTKRLGPEHPETINAFNRLKWCQGDGNGTVEDDKSDSDGAASVRSTSTLAFLLPPPALPQPEHPLSL